MTTYCKPFKRGESWRSQDFGAFPNNGVNPAGGHTGNDEAAPSGTPVHAAGDGVIIHSGWFDDSYADNLLWLLDFGGETLVLDCGDDEPTFVYAHLLESWVSYGTRVKKGQVIGLSGNSGTRTTGDHLHNEAIAPGYNLNSPTLGRVNPDNYLTEWPEDISTEKDDDELSAKFETDVRAELAERRKMDFEFQRDVRAELAAHRAMLIADRGLTEEQLLQVIKEAVITVEINGAK